MRGENTPPPTLPGRQETLRAAVMAALMNTLAACVALGLVTFTAEQFATIQIAINSNVLLAFLLLESRN